MAGGAVNLKIVHVIVGLNVGGAELMLKRLIESHAKHSEYEHSVISLTDLGSIGPDLQAKGTKVTALGMRNAIDLPKTYFRLLRQLSFAKPDVVQTWMYHADLLGGLAARSAGIKNIIWGIRTTEIKSGGSKATLVIRALCALLSRFVPAVIVCAADAARAVHEKVGYRANKMQVISNGFDTGKLIAGPAQRAALRELSGLTCEHLVVGSVGRFNAVKDQHSFIQAAALLSPKYPHLRFMMVGRDLTENNQQLMQWISATGFSEKFVLLGERTDVPVCLAAMDIFCMHSRTEGFPNVVGEAMAMGRPCVVTDVGDAAFLVGGTGIVVPKENPTELARGIEELLGMTVNELVELGKMAQQRIYENFTMDHSRLKFESVYKEMTKIE